jgi:phospholipid/cholesterol/gamma-HCH transport system ATP-binding protein
VIDSRDRRAADVIRRKQEARVRSAIQDELSADESAEARPRPEDPGPLEGAVIELERVHLAFDRPVLEDVSFAAFPGETLVIVGESGTGKSTTLKLILRLLQPDSGRVYVDGQDIAGLSFTEALAVRQKMGMVFQSAALFDSMTVFENVAYPLREHTDLGEDDIEARVREKLEFVDLVPDEVMEKLPAELSGGMKKRVGIARGMANNAEIMLYDEPTSGLDPAHHRHDHAAHHEAAARAERHQRRRLARHSLGLSDGDAHRAARRPDDPVPRNAGGDGRER